MKFLADENVHLDIISGLRQEGFEVSSIQEIGMVGSKDNDILDYSEGRYRIHLPSS